MYIFEHDCTPTGIFDAYTAYTSWWAESNGAIYQNLGHQDSVVHFCGLLSFEYTNKSHIHPEQLFLPWKNQGNPSWRSRYPTSGCDSAVALQKHWRDTSTHTNPQLGACEPTLGFRSCNCQGARASEHFRGFWSSCHHYFAVKKGGTPDLIYKNLPFPDQEQHGAPPTNIS